MKKCCWCISVHVAAMFVGSVDFILSALALILSVPYVFATEPLNPFLDHLPFLSVKALMEQNVPSLKAHQIAQGVKTWTETGLMAATFATGIYILFPLVMIIGVGIRKRVLMLPHLIFKKLIIVIYMVVAIEMNLLGFLISALTGVVLLGVSSLLLFVEIYFWMVVRKSYIELGIRDRMRSLESIVSNYSPPPQWNNISPEMFNMS